MQHTAGRVHRASYLLGLVVLQACSDPFPFDAQPLVQATQEEEVCAASVEWLPTTPALDLFKPLPHPAGECPFYRGSWQNFLIATQPDPTTGQPALQAYPGVADLFDGTEPAAAQRAWLGDIRQAGLRQILIDQHGRPIYYGIHVNPAFAAFVDANGLRTAAAIRSADPELFFPAGVAEFKSAWQEVEADDDSLDTYITMQTTVARLSQEAGRIIEHRDNPREVTVRLLALHVVFTLPGHPEFIWATFEHSAGPPGAASFTGLPDVAPSPPGGSNPPLTDPNNLDDSTVVSPDDYVLYAHGTAVNAANHGFSDSDLELDAQSQTFPEQQTSIYRMFPASKSNTTEPDAAIRSLNFNVQTLFARARAAGQLAASDKRGNYRLVGAVWLDKPEFFKNDSSLQNDATSPFAHEPGFAQDIRDNGTDSPLSILAGEDRLSSTAMESFTQAPDAFPNCFACHNTQAMTDKGVPLDHDGQGAMLLPPRLLNVSHVFTQFLLEQAPQ